MTVSPDWWKDFFSGLVVEFWKGAIPEAATTADVDFFAAKLALAAGRTVLDVPCGHGRFALELARRGCRVTGVDISADFLAAARAAAQAEGLDISWRQSDMRDLPWQDAFEAALCAGNSFGYFDDAGNQAFLGAVAGALKPGGRFLLDLGWIAESRFPNFVVEREIEAGGVRFSAHNAYDPITAHVESRYTLMKGGTKEERTALQRVYAANEVLRLLSNVGFEGFQCYGSQAGEPFVLGSPRLLLICSRAG
jgi:SAM-dependent methyltransferase